ncbi:hypothetical protein DPMN_091576 [Dreissena polymorpha]|uniref:Uncharacterized protein n=1 Tax=Dreissena polymorpha TaxID=45954 RepID=A0A9D4R0U7_DREPO|nr:hypothetical protein DPMN_091576 [Dreissena polymorpha]
MARQRPTLAPQVEIDRIVIKEVQYQLEVNRCRNEEFIVKGNFGWAWPMWSGRPRIDHIVIREVHYQFEVNRCRNEEIIVKGNFGWAWPMWAGRPRINRIVIREVQYQFEVNRCRNEEIIISSSCLPYVLKPYLPVEQIGTIINLKGNFGWAWPMWAGRPKAEIDRIVIREVYKRQFGWAWPMWAGRPRIDCIVIREVQYQFEENWCRNEEIIFQGSSAYSVGGDSGQDGRKTERTTIFPLFLRKAWG